MAGTVSLLYEGPRSLIVELEREVNYGDVIDVPADVAARLLSSHGFSEAGKRKEPTQSEVLKSVPDLDNEQLDELLRTENLREKPRAKVVAAVQAEQAARQEAAGETPEGTGDEGEGEGAASGEGDA